jgi:hypothetical protein
MMVSSANLHAWPNTGIEKDLPVFLSQAYNLKAVADYETGPASIIPAEHAATALEGPVSAIILT